MGRTVEMDRSGRWVSREACQKFMECLQSHELKKALRIIEYVSSRAAIGSCLIFTKRVALLRLRKRAMFATIFTGSKISRRFCARIENTRTMWGCLAYESMEVLNCLDLFSGIGGFSYALRSERFRTVAYCERDPRCVKVLTKNMTSGRLDNAPIFSDVETLNETDLSGIAPIHIITAGSPCQDISRANVYANRPHSLGIDGPKSRLIFHVFRIAKLLPSLQHILFENSPMIVSRGLDRVTCEIVKMGWVAAWSVFDAREVGSVHSRQRWFCMASRPESRHALKMKSPEAMFATKEPARAVPRFKESTYRNRMLGNAVVPHVVKLALSTLDQALDPKSVGGKGDVCDRRRKVFVMAEDGHIISHWRYVHLRPHTPINLKLVQDDLTITRNIWATPTATCWYRAEKLTLKCAIAHLAIQIQYDLETKKRVLNQFGHSDMYKVSVNPLFVEWLMGYPFDYTKL